MTRKWFQADGNGLAGGGGTAKGFVELLKGFVGKFLKVDFHGGHRGIEEGIPGFLPRR